jgi:glutamate dehydrogenase
MQSHVLEDSSSGYVAPAFEGKERQMEVVKDAVSERGFIPDDIVDSEVDWFYHSLGAFSVLNPSFL